MSATLCNHLTRTESLPRTAYTRRNNLARAPASAEYHPSSRTIAPLASAAAAVSQAAVAGQSSEPLNASKPAPVSSFTGYLSNTRGVAVVSQTGAANGRPKSSNQDSFLTHTIHPLPGLTTSIVGIFDGHGRAGHVASARVKESIKDSLEPCSRLALKAAALSDPCSDPYASCSADYSQPPSPRFAASNLASASALSSAAGSTAAAVGFTPDCAQLCLEETFARAADAMKGAAAEFMQSGSTAVVCMLLQDSVVAAWAGDSRAVMGVAGPDGYSAVELTHDHKPNNLSEMARIISAGGRVARVHSDKHGNPAGPFRVFLPTGVSPGLSVARAFGDMLLQQAGVIPTPEIATFPLTPAAQSPAGTKPSHVLVLASDGLWEQVGSREAVELAGGCTSAEAAAALLLQTAEVRWAEAYRGWHRDDITICVAFL